MRMRRSDFGDFLVSLNGLHPDILQLGGGYMGKARELGRFLRERKISAGVGRTIPTGCRVADANDESCRRLIASRREPSARLRTDGARCYSACVEAFIGASSRQVPADARLGFTGPIWSRMGAPKKPRMTQASISSESATSSRWAPIRRSVDTAEQVRFDRLHVVSRQEIAKFGVETRGAL